MKTVISLVGLLMVVSSLSAEEKAKPPKQTFTYKTVDGLAVDLDVYRPASEAIMPVVVWIHGGALITGSRRDVPGNIADLCQREGYALVSIDYRLAPEVKAPAIVEDVKDAFRWIHQEGPKKAHLDPTRIVITGGSAGGYLTMMAGVVVKPKPTALVAYWGYGDVDGEWYTKPSEYYRTTMALIPREEALRGLDGKPISNLRDSAHYKARGLYYRYLRQNGLWTKEVTGFDPEKDKAKIDTLCPVRNITSEYPPILMIHGDVDEDVPFEKSVDMDRELTRQKVPHEFIRVAKGRHGLAGADKQVIADAHQRALEFIKKSLAK